ncbi:hypothetical protein CONCODRAFT_76719 [Conidiobolus coronatus NRRL 28638]|uniref:Uncharacterized protein n=1 Tax=Conidiobolus coronatus (strain ATCC 28846 / CBS 209.66 / NRRL 28638) TaxID=796925 RepID=A0A137PI37_CONC2|nr:hypothetical protein CONCODRAFT_76719 [Conidiobolus coronatus NRRL 28638]|eukprot:KXN74640.1 hypothetical protein CONCODRAFT_76719 [Conidiobolus coronatus NRRL 28638]
MKKLKTNIEHRVLPQRNRKPPTLYPITPLPIKVEDDNLRERAKQLENHHLQIIHSEIDSNLLDSIKGSKKTKTKVRNIAGIKKLKGNDIKAFNTSIKKSKKNKNNPQHSDLPTEPNFEQYHQVLLKREKQYFRREQELTKYAKAHQKLVENYQAQKPLKKLKKSYAKTKELKEPSLESQQNIRVLDNFIINEAPHVREVFRPKVPRPFLADTLYSPYITQAMKQYISKPQHFDLAKFDWYPTFAKLKP